MQFHLGKPILAMLLVAILSGAVVFMRDSPHRADLTLWVFDEAHAEVYRALRPGFERRSGRSLQIELIGNTALNMRLTSLFLSDHAGEVLPDAAEIEIGGIGRYFRPPVDHVGFLPLNHFLENSGFRTIHSLDDPGRPGWNARLDSDGLIYSYQTGKWSRNPARTRPDAWIDRIAGARLEPWTKKGVIFGLPHDVHPVTLTYRDDLFREAGIDLSQATTWPLFQRMCLDFQAYWAARGLTHRHALELPPASSDELVMMLLQRRINVVDNEGRIHMADPRVAETIAFYAQLAGGRRAIGGISEGGTGAWINDLMEGNICCFWTPDWRADQIRSYANPDVLRGRLRMMPLPKFEPSDAPTATWGGTMIGIPRRCAHPSEAWKLIEYLYYSDDGLKAQAQSHLIPALPEAWDQPAYRQPDPCFGGQHVDQLYAELAAQIPLRCVTPETSLAQLELSVVVGRAVEYVNKQDPGGLQPQIENWLHWLQSDVERRVEHATFDER